MWFIRAALRRPISVLVAILAVALTAVFAVTRMRIEAKLQNGFQAAAEVVIVTFGDDTEPYRILAWDDRPGDGGTAWLNGVNP